MPTAYLAVAHGHRAARRALAWKALAGKRRPAPRLTWWLAGGGEENRYFLQGGAVSWVNFLTKRASETALRRAHLLGTPSASRTEPSELVAGVRGPALAKDLAELGRARGGARWFRRLAALQRRRRGSDGGIRRAQRLVTGLDRVGTGLGRWRGSGAAFPAA